MVKVAIGPPKSGEQNVKKRGLVGRHLYFLGRRVAKKGGIFGRLYCQLDNVSHLSGQNEEGEGGGNGCLQRSSEEQIGPELTSG